MNRSMRIFGAALLMIGTCGLSADWASAQDTPAPQPQQRDGIDIGALPGVAPDAELLPVGPMEANNIRGTLSTATEAAMTRGQLRSVAQRLTTPDEARLHEFVRRDHPQLDQLIEQLNEAWQARYNERFSMGDRAAVYPAQIIEIRLGVTSNSLAARGRGMNGIALDQRAQGTDRPGITARAEGQVGDGVTVRTEVQPRPDAQPASAREGVTQSNVVTVIFPATGELPEVHVPLVNEGTITDTWRIDIPLHVDGQTVHDNLVRHMTKALQQQEQWPADVNEGYRNATQIVMMSLLDIKDGQHEALPGERQRIGEHEKMSEPAARSGAHERPQQPAEPQQQPQPHQ